MLLHTAITSQQLFGQLLVGLINGSFYALLSLGLAVIFGMLNIVNFAHGALYMLGAYVALFLLRELSLNYWVALIVAPLAVGALGAVLQTTLLQRLAGLDPLYGLLWRVWFTVSNSRSAHGSAKPGVHDPSQLSPLGHRLLAGGVLVDMAGRRKNEAGRLSARRD
jgi:hypothetical protein